MVDSNHDGKISKQELFDFFMGMLARWYLSIISYLFILDTIVSNKKSKPINKQVK